MSTASSALSTAPGGTAPPRVTSDLVGARLPKWAVYGSAVIGWAVAVGLKFLLDWTG